MSQGAGGKINWGTEIDIYTLLYIKEITNKNLLKHSTPRPRSGAAAKSARLQQCRNGREEPPRVRGQGRWQRGATLRPRSVAAGRRHPASEVRGFQEKPPTPKARTGGQEEQPEERWL